MGWDGTGINCYGMGWDRKICLMDKPAYCDQNGLELWKNRIGLCQKYC